MVGLRNILAGFLFLLMLGGGVILLFSMLEQHNYLDTVHLFSRGNRSRNVNIQEQSCNKENVDGDVCGQPVKQQTRTQIVTTAGPLEATLLPRTKEVPVAQLKTSTQSTVRKETLVGTSHPVERLTSTQNIVTKETLAQTLLPPVKQLTRTQSTVVNKEKGTAFPTTTASSEPGRPSNSPKTQEATKREISDSTARPAWLTDAFLRNNPLGKFPSAGVCRYMGIRKQQAESGKESSPPNIVCKAHKPDDDACKLANSYYGKPGYVEDRKCDEQKHPDICHFQRNSNESVYKLQCDIKVCGGDTLTIGSVNPEQGIVTDWQSVQPFSTDMVLEYVKRNAANGFDFCFMKCGSIFQALAFPPVVKEGNSAEKRKRININVVVLDSIARQHFYRVLPKSVAALSKIVYDESIPATALDFELFQAISQHTFDNIRPFFSGIVKGDTQFSSSVQKSLNPLGVPVLYGKYRKYGYQTMFQEDSCWFDYWGVMLTDVERRSQPKSTSAFKSRWKEFKDKVSKYNVDKYGLTHFSCPVVQKYGYTNHYDRPSKVCLNGQFFSRYFLEYIHSTFQTISRDKSAAPMISYMHFNTGHTPSGTRIRNVDTNLPNFLIKMARDPYTITILMADHGHTRTGYGQTVEGRYELFSPSFFMILPYYAAGVLGKDRVAALVENQRRLFTTADIHKALMSLDDPTKGKSQDPNVVGIFAVLPGNRSCVDIPLMPLTRCKCEGQEQSVADNAPKHKWLAEFALGQLNNMIQEQYLKGQSGKNTRGYGKCTRLVGKSYDHSVERQSGSTILTNFDLHFAPPAGYKKDEVIKAEVEHPLKPANGVTMKSFDRQSQYSKFKSCADESVDIKLCACAQGETKSVIETTEDMKALIAQPMFGATTELKDLHSGCVFLLKRRHNTIAVAYEVANICADKTFKVSVTGSNYNMLLSQSVPMSVTLRPRTIHFLLSAIRYVMNDSYFNFSPSVELVS